MELCIPAVHQTNCHLATQLAIDYSIKFLETSAKSSINVEEVSTDQTLFN